MKNFIYILLILFSAGVASCGNAGKQQANGDAPPDSVLKRTTVRFDAVEKDLGQVKEGEKLVLSYEVFNTGDADLVLQSVTASCGCTTPKYDKKPIRPGRKGTIELSFDTKGRPGKQRKTVMVTTNTEPKNTVLTFNCEVISD